MFRIAAVLLIGCAAVRAVHAGLAVGKARKQLNKAIYGPDSREDENSVSHTLPIMAPTRRSTSASRGTPWC